MRGLIIVLFMIVSSFAQDNYSKKILKNDSKMVVLGFTGTSIDKNSQIYKDIEFGLGGVILLIKTQMIRQKQKYRE